jgi:hypothetical protein
MLHDGCNKMSHCNCYTPHIKQVQHVLEIDLKFQNLKMLFTYPDTSETTQTLQKTYTHTHTELAIKRVVNILMDCIS